MFFIEISKSSTLQKQKVGTIRGRGGDASLKSRVLKTAESGYASFDLQRSFFSGKEEDENCEEGVFRSLGRAFFFSEFIVPDQGG